MKERRGEERRREETRGRQEKREVIFLSFSSRKKYHIISSTAIVPSEKLDLSLG
jgi:hypothetical protein